jgi:predicted RNase H-like nuclease (RuvC/YqgF family)
MAMSQETDKPAWWVLHMRKVRGEPLSEAEQKFYDEEMARQDAAAPLKSNIETLKKMRETVLALAQESMALRAQVERLEQQVQAVERALSSRTRELLGVQE